MESILVNYNHGTTPYGQMHTWYCNTNGAQHQHGSWFPAYEDVVKYVEHNLPNDSAIECILYIYRMGDGSWALVAATYEPTYLPMSNAAIIGKFRMPELLPTFLLYAEMLPCKSP